MRPRAWLLAAVWTLPLQGTLDLPRLPVPESPEPWSTGVPAPANAAGAAAYAIGSWVDALPTKRALEAAAGGRRTLPAQVWRRENMRVLLLFPMERSTLELERRPVGAMLRLDLFGR